MEEELSQLPRRCLLASAFLTYLPAQPEEVRGSFIGRWCQMLSLADFRLCSFLGSEKEQLTWKAEGLPADPLSLENAVLLLQIVDYDDYESAIRYQDSVKAGSDCFVVGDSPGQIVTRFRSVETRKKVAEGSILNSPSGARETSNGRWYNRWPEEECLLPVTCLWLWITRQQRGDLTRFGPRTRLN
ncbi:hypothetical protein HPB47_006360 [Ixodes persulcatus]|uniref:Uncharacterized protein n=1 Tax=Ixodes persulcatus TaxID=34615 RepID=A0AC60PB35_IXOPE|nr:hypothetical protein HPB47_006360 [Ixodes persulcatus]